MRLPDAVVPLFEYPIGDILAALPDATSPLWDKAQFRQKSHNVHRLSRSIVFRWLSDTWTADQPLVVVSSNFNPVDLTAAVETCAAALTARMPGTVAKLVLAEVAPGGKIDLHWDGTPSLALAHRCHVPIVSNENVDFLVDDKSYYLAPGMAYEFDNTRMHGVNNRSATRRVHLICDIMPPEYA
jgi:hypothetical protein